MLLPSTERASCCLTLDGLSEGTYCWNQMKPSYVGWVCQTSHENHKVNYYHFDPTYNETFRRLYIITIWMIGYTTLSYKNKFIRTEWLEWKEMLTMVFYVTHQGYYGEISSVLRMVAIKSIECCACFDVLSCVHMYL